jgi:ferritin-like metal-binding protein YciE
MSTTTAPAPSPAKMAKASKSDKLRQAMEQHLEETKGQVDRLEQVFDKLDARTRGKRCEAMEGLKHSKQATGSSS